MGLVTGKESPKGETAKEKPETVVAEMTYSNSIWTNSKGEFGQSVKVSGSPMEGETKEAAARRVNKFAIAKLRELEVMMTKEKP